MWLVSCALQCYHTAADMNKLNEGSCSFGETSRTALTKNP